MSRPGSKVVAIAEQPQYRERPQPLEDDSETHSGRMTGEQDLESLKSWTEEAGDPFAVVELSCGTCHCFARTAGGHIYGWGSNSYGELGFADDSQSYFWVPKELVLPHKLVKQVSCGSEFTLAITWTGELWSWGKGFEGQLGLGHCRDEPQPCRVGLEHVVSCAAGEQHSGAIAEMPDGRFLYTWGMADSGVLGLGNFITCGPCNLPSQVDFDPEGKKTAVHPIMVKCGPNSTGVLSSGKADDDSGLWTFGNGWYGRLGHGDNNSQVHPARIQRGLPKGPLLTFSMGTDHSAAITMDHELYIWGKASLLGEVQHVLQPKRFSIESASFRLVVCGESETFVVDTSGRLFAWGSNNRGQLGLGPAVGSFLQQPLHVKPVHDPVSSLISGGSFTIAHLETGDVMAWGSQSCGRLGLVEVKEERICWDPSLVVATWSTAAAVSKKSSRHAGRASVVKGSRTDGTTVTEAPEEPAKGSSGKEKTVNVVSFVMLQTVLKQETQDHRSEALKLYADQLEHTAQEIVKDIQKLQKEEESLRKLEAQLSDSLKMNLRWFRGLIVPDASSTLVDPRLPHHLSSYARMCWILQHQATYLTQLSQYIHGDEEIFLEAIDALFGDVKDERLVHLFNSLQTCMIAKEAENAGGSPEKFMDKRDSVSFMVFSQRALRQAFAKEILFPFLGSKDSILELVGSISSSAQSPGFCLSYADFKEKLGSDGKGKDEVELNNIYSLSLNAFRDFLTGGFLRIIRKIQLPKSLRLAMRQVSLASQRWKDSDKLADIDDNWLRPFQPALRLFCYGIIEPIMREGARYAVPANFLKKSQQDYKPDDPQIAANFECIADFLDQMLSNTIDPKEKALMSAARLVKEELLGYVRQQSEVEDTMSSDILGAVLDRHYSGAKSFVTMSQAQVMKLSNLLKEWSSKLRIKENDPLDACVKSVPLWDKETIMISERFEVRMNFEIDTRFLMTEQDVQLCKQSMCPLPSWACANSSPRLVYIEEEATGNDQGAFFESLFQRLAPLESKNFASLRNELQERRAALSSAAEEGYLEMTNDLDTASQLITEWMDVGAEPRQLLDLLTERVRGRQRQFRYLEVTNSYLKSILERQLEYKQDLKQQVTELKDAVGFSLSMKLPHTLSKACNDVGVTPSFQIIQKKMEFVPTLMATKDMAEIGCSYIPMATYPVAKLKKMKVLVEVCPPHNAMQKMMEMTFKKLDAQAVEITVCIAQGSNKNVVKTMTLDPAKLNQLRAAKSDEIAEFGEPGEPPFMTCNASNFVSLLTKIEKGKP